MRLSDFLNSLTDETIDTANLERDSEGQLRIHLDSSMLPGVNVDTYQSFNGDSWEESELDYYSTEGIPEWLVGHPAAQRAVVELEWDDFDRTYDHRAILRALSEAAADGLVHDGGVSFDQIIVDVEVTSVYSPTYYNFSTDSFAGWLTLDTEALSESLDDIDTEALEDWAQTRWASRDGFHSHIPGYFDNEPQWAMVWAAVARVLVDADYDGTLATSEAEWEAYGEHTTTTLNHRGAARIWEAITGEEVPDDLDLHDSESLTEALHDRIPVQEEALI